MARFQLGQQEEGRLLRAESAPQSSQVETEPQWDGIKRWGLWEVSGYGGGGLMNEIHALKRPWEAASPFHRVRTQLSVS